MDESGALRPGFEALAAELRGGWLARVGAGEVLADALGEPDGPPAGEPDRGTDA